MNSSEKKQLKIAACKVRMGAIEGVFHAKIRSSRRFPFCR